MHTIFFRFGDFLHGVPSSSLPSVKRDFNVEPLTPADRIRMANSYVTSSPHDGGLGIAPGAQSWNRVEGIMALHDEAFNHQWIKAWTSQKVGLSVGDSELDRIRTQVRIQT